MEFKAIEKFFITVAVLLHNPWLKKRNKEKGRDNFVLGLLVDSSFHLSGPVSDRNITGRSSEVHLVMDTRIMPPHSISIFN